MILKINELYHSIQGESSFSGLPCIFIRLTYCNLRCSYCDSEYTFHEGSDMNINEILNIIRDQYQFHGRVILPLPNDPQIIEF